MGLSRVDVVASGIHRGARYTAPVTRWWSTDVAWLRDARHLPDSLLHQRRRRAAHTKLRLLKPRRFLFVCQGNICRSPFAAAAFARLCSSRLRDRVTAASAGFIGPGRMPPPQALAAGLRFGIDMSAHRSAVVTEESLKAADLVVVMSADQARDLRTRVKGISTKMLVLGDLDPSATNRRTIADPWEGSDSTFDASYGRIARCVVELVRFLAANS